MLKAKKLPRSNLPAAEPAESTSGQSSVVKPRVVPGWRPWFFRLAALVLTPLVLLLILEAALRMAGYGYSPRFFLRGTLRGMDVFHDNVRFSRRFFPPRLTRNPRATVIPAAKAPNTIRIFVLGESAAMGDPEPAFGFPRALETLLSARFPGIRFEVVSTAFVAINSHVILPIVRECASLQGDLWVVYMGNNEVVGPFGSGTILSSQVPSLALIRASLAVKTTRTGQLLNDLIERLAANRNRPSEWGGMEMMVNQKVAQSDPRMAKVYAHFERNLADILRAGVRGNVPILLSTVGSNLRDCAPFASLHRPDLTPPQLAEWEKLYQAGAGREAQHQFDEADSFYRLAAKLDAAFADLSFRLGRCALALGKPEEARRQFLRARDEDALRFRADTRLNEIVQRAATGRQAEGIHLVDGEDFLARNSPNGIPGEDLFYEHVHLTFDGNYWLARRIAEQTEQVLPTLNSRPATGPWLSVAECAQRLLFTDWNRHKIWTEVRRRMQEPPFTFQIDHAVRLQRIQDRIDPLRPATEPSALKATAVQYAAAVAARCEDPDLREQYARILEAIGDIPGAEGQWRQIVALQPHHASPYLKLADLIQLQGRGAEAQPFLESALRIDPDSYEAILGLGVALAKQGQHDAAIQCFAGALRLKPGSVEAHLNLGLSLAHQGRLAQAKEHYQEALRLNPESVAAHLNWGKLLATEGNTEAAARHYAEAVRLRPGDAVAHHNLANALLALGQSGEAARHYFQAIQLNPNLPEPRYNLGLELAKQGRISEAAEQFAEVVRLKPDFADAHLNLGVALATQGRYAQAADHFRETLRLDPANANAKQFLERALTRPGQHR